ncbi:hypothetical protein [Amycolatopsis tucumanensis]|uniref:Uncharacterized protein n=1 Tax=Amycolatopsis tucumanensis TaxID=401106 RepID=A0ABP7HGV0_9PSEU|nr:hypothetical protein [Amycolatopsis tucumanensis]
MFVVAAVVIGACAEPFAHALIVTGMQLGIDQFLLVQWLAPLVGSLPLACLANGGGAALHLDDRQAEEFLLAATQTLLGIGALLALWFPRWSTWTLPGLFAAQFALPGQTARYLLCGIYAALAALGRKRRHILPTLTAPFRRDAGTVADEQQTLTTTR